MKPVKGIWFKRRKVVDLEQPRLEIAENVALKNILVIISFLCRWFGQNIVVILTKNPLADFPTVFFHISGFDICNETLTNIPRDENKSQLSRAIDYHSPFFLRKGFSTWFHLIRTSRKHKSSHKEHLTFDNTFMFPCYLGAETDQLSNRLVGF